MGANSEAAGVPHMKEGDTTEEEQEMIYAFFNAATPGVEGVSMQDYGATMEIFKARMVIREGDDHHYYCCGDEPSNPGYYC